MFDVEKLIYNTITMTNDRDEGDLFRRVESEDDEPSIFRAAVEGGEMDDINEAAEHIETLHDKRQQAVELGLSGAKKRMDDRLAQTRKDLEALSSAADNRHAESRAESLASMAEGANVELDSLADEDDSVSSAAGEAQLSDDLAPRDREAKVARLSESAAEAERLGLNGAADEYRKKIHQLRKGR